MSPRTKKQFKEIREAKRKLILDKALFLFATDGYYPTSISKIAKEAGISKGLIYNYFSSKEELIVEIVLDGFDQIMEYFDPNRDGILTKDELRYFIDGIFTAVQEKHHFWKLYFSILSQPPVLKLVEKKLLEFIGPSIKMLEDYFRRSGVKNPVAESRLFTAILDGVCFNYIVDFENFPLEKIKDRIIELYIK